MPEPQLEVCNIQQGTSCHVSSAAWIPHILSNAYHRWKAVEPFLRYYKHPAASLGGKSLQYQYLDADC